MRPSSELNGQSSELKDGIAPEGALNQHLDAQLAAMDFGRTRLFFIMGQPRSDIGKGHLTARLAHVWGTRASILKFDGLLNTNVNGQHPSPLDDFATYRRFLPHVAMGGAHQILGGEMLYEFISQYGGSNDHLTFRPHLSKYAALLIYRRWQEIDRPEALFVEVGGTPADLEVGAYLSPAITILRRRAATRLFLLTEVTIDGGLIKTRVVQSALQHGVSCGLTFDVVFLRTPPGAMAAASDEQIRFAVKAKLENALIYGGEAPPVVPIPDFEPPELAGYLEFLDDRRQHIFGGDPILGAGAAPGVQREASLASLPIETMGETA